MAKTPTPLLKQFQDYLDKAAGLSEPNSHPSPLPPSLRVGVVGGGMTGLYSALFLQKHFPGVQVKIFEAGNQVGGYMQTHKFSEEPYQYFDCGPMRFPDTEMYKPMFDLINYLNKELPADLIELIEYKYQSSGNRVLVNNTKQQDGRVMSVEYAVKHYTELGFQEADGEASTKLAEAFVPIAEAFENNFQEALTKYGKMSIYEYFYHELGWSFEKISYVETMSATTNVFYYDVLMLFLNDRVFGLRPAWKSIKGLAMLPRRCAEAVQSNGGEIQLNAKVDSIRHLDKAVRIGCSQPRSVDLTYEEFDAVIMAIPCPHIRSILDRPYFGARSEQALRASSFCMVSKFGIRFHSRFWERTDLTHPPSFGGMSRTDLPIRFVVYPSYGIGDTGKGVLVVYNWTGDASQWQLRSKEEKLKTALDNLQLLYPEVNIAKEYAGGEPGDHGYLDEAFEVDWWGFPYFLPGQFLNYYPDLARPHGDVYFAGAYLGSTLSWSVCALESARRAVRQLASKYGMKDIDYLQ